MVSQPEQQHWHPNHHENLKSHMTNFCLWFGAALWMTLSVQKFEPQVQHQQQNCYLNQMCKNVGWVFIS
jgi:hypothetical protein